MRLDVLVFMGSVRETTPPKPPRLGERVARAAADWLAEAGQGAEIVDPLGIEQPAAFRPHFAYPKGGAPETMERLAERIAEADAYVMVSPEYNHSISPALTGLLNHFGASRFALKPSAIVTYSAGQWGGTRAAVAMRAYLSELGCLPVSAMIHVPHAADVFDADGRLAEGQDAARWSKYLGRTFDQMIWWAEAARAQRAVAEGPGTFRRDPMERDAP